MSAHHNPLPQFTLDSHLAQDETALETAKTLCLGLIEMRDRADAATLRGCRRALRRYRSNACHGRTHRAITYAKHTVEDLIDRAGKPNLPDSILYDLDGGLQEIDELLDAIREYWDGGRSYDEMRLD